MASCVVFCRPEGIRTDCNKTRLIAACPDKTRLAAGCLVAGTADRCTFRLLWSLSPRSILVSAGEASGDYYAAELVRELRRRWPECEFFGCAGPHLRDAGVEPVVRSEDLSVVGIVEVIGHLPRIWLRFKRLIGAAARRKPDLAILTDSPDFHFRVARKLKGLGVPVIYLIAPQVWAWRKGRVKIMRRVIDQLLCIFPFEEAFFRRHRIRVTYIGHPLAARVRPTFTRAEFFRKHNLDEIGRAHV